MQVTKPTIVIMSTYLRVTSSFSSTHSFQFNTRSLSTACSMWGSKWLYQCKEHYRRRLLLSSPSPQQILTCSPDASSPPRRTVTRRMVSIHVSVPMPNKPPDPLSLLTQEELHSRAEQLLDWWLPKRRVLCITGAGLSTESGIPDYRGNQGSYHSGHKPMVHDQFMKSEYQRKRYWGRGMIGWKLFHECQPNQGHYALAELERTGRLGVWLEDHPRFHSFRSPDDEEDYLLDWNLIGPKPRKLSIITQNVDRLHIRAGSTHVMELHGRTDLLVCMHCQATKNRDEFHTELESLNADWLQRQRAKVNMTELRPDGDANVVDEFEQVQVPSCPHCGEGFFKPDVVFFGDTVPLPRVEFCRAAVEACDGLLVVGSSLAVHSAFRYVKAAHSAGIPVCLLNVGPTRADDLPDVLKLESPAGPTLRRIVDRFQEVQRSREEEFPGHRSVIAS